jgi:hypothetical protein
MILRSILYPIKSYSRKLSRIPAATAEPITPATFGAIACISKWFDGSSRKPSICDTLALSGTAETPAEPIKGFILFSSDKNKFIDFAFLLKPLFLLQLNIILIIHFLM